jgi:predicted transcriptional regulator
MPTGERMRKITISLPEELVEYADNRAQELNASRSQVIGMALSAVMTREEEKLAAEGYRFYAQEAGEFADAASRAMAEAWTDGWLPTEPSA